MHVLTAIIGLQAAASTHAGRRLHARKTNIKMEHAHARRSRERQGAWLRGEGSGPDGVDGKTWMSREQRGC